METKILKSQNKYFNYQIIPCDIDIHFNSLDIDIPNI